jgi:alpha-glucosidase
MQWDASANAGFTKATPWLPVPPNAATNNVKAEEGDPNSLLAWYRSLIHLKKTNAAFAHGENYMLDTENKRVLSWARKTDGAPPVVIAVNFTAEPQTVNLTIPWMGTEKTLLKSPGTAEPVSLGGIELGPYGVYIGEVQ